MVRDTGQTDRQPLARRIVAVAPAWLLSVMIHLLVAVAGALLVRGAARVVSDEPARSAEIVLARRGADDTTYFSDESAPSRHEVMKPASGDTASASAAGGRVLMTDPPPLIPSISLPELPGTAQIRDSAVGAAPQLNGQPRGRPYVPPDPRVEAAILAEDALIPREKVPTGPQAQLSIFGSQQALGRSFVFVIDHSKSMGGEGLGAIQAAAKELAARIDQLTDQQTFQVVAYNQSVVWLTDRELIPATADNKRKLVAFIANLAAYGQTEHSRGLLAALRLKPEVIFLLTDGGEPPLDPGQLKLIRDEAAGRIAIHCIHFGRERASDRNSFLARLARDTGGSYVYVDMSAR